MCSFVAAAKLIEDAAARREVDIQIGVRGPRFTSRRE
jgi:hypothetical protein